MLLEAHVDDLVLRSGDVLANIVGADGQLAVAAIDEHRQLDQARAPEIDERIEGGAHRTAGIEDVIDEDEDSPRDVEVDVGGANDGLGADGGEVVAIESDVELPDRHGDPLEARD